MKLIPETGDLGKLWRPGLVRVQGMKWGFRFRV